MPVGQRPFERLIRFCTRGNAQLISLDSTLRAARLFLFLSRKS
jgi:hypothetical protein